MVVDNISYWNFLRRRNSPSYYFSFNDPNGMCKTCEGIGRIITLDLDKDFDKEKSLNEGAILLPGYTPGSWQWKMYAATGFFDCDKKIKDAGAAT